MLLVLYMRGDDKQYPGRAAEFDVNIEALPLSQKYQFAGMKNQELLSR